MTEQAHNGRYLGCDASRRRPDEVVAEAVGDDFPLAGHVGPNQFHDDGQPHPEAPRPEQRCGVVTGKRHRFKLGQLEARFVELGPREADVGQAGFRHHGTAADVLLFQRPPCDFVGVRKNLHLAGVTGGVEWEGGEGRERRR